ncbi:MAG TPA: hypothetical protein RMH85_25130 [Polyangiaceae bacterium LLY-WYZ-15_(1-7)]|nr:hypothetical protein [Sandaracinus sp.]HJL06167.1 hypothetical protein [Polyangiaceae bacterium LLY-WYZ-15_(1-7)]MBJ75277.1 hypothetical protein [Sandaracinus sp.]HJL11784.1 hypothetical protein [Polyangiaceae bacterium LLY-WYZ-15_(1-7)]HJL21849.1 hypothetical protein [Polyangiaceae bacterium LLY-WYZ-15_(1-7)]
MGIFHAIQVALAALVAVLVWRRVRRLAFDAAALEGPPFVRALLKRVTAGELDGAMALAQRGGEAWLARLAREGLEARAEGLDPGLALAELFRDLRFEAADGLRTLRILAHVGTAAGLLGALGQYIWIQVGDPGLAGLVAGLPEERAQEGAFLAIAIGIATAGFALYARAQLKGVAKELLDGGRNLKERLENALLRLDGEDAPSPWTLGAEG